MLTSDHTPPRLAKGKEWMIRYRVKDPVTGAWRVKKEKLNELRKSVAPREFNAWVGQRIAELSTMLRLGWNPFRDGDGKPSGTELKEACERFLASKERERRRKDTLRSYSSNAGLLLKWVATLPTPRLTVAAFTAQHAKAFMNEAYVKRELRPKTFNNCHTFYITLWNWFMEQDYTKENVFKAVKKKEVDPESATRRPPTKEERDRIREDLERTNPRFFTFCLLCFHCGIRPKEAFMLRPTDFNLRDAVITVPGAVAKNKRTMAVAVPAVLMERLHALNLHQQPQDAYVFSSRCDWGWKLKDSRYSGKLWVALRERIALSQEVTMYQLKHAGAQQLSRDGVGSTDLMNHFRHHDLSETSRYSIRRDKDGVPTVREKATPF